ncbi:MULTISPECIES: hypothetical protein [Prevotellaceae]|uniref:hypothetical protein n=1 Tax=Leyella stercorea TaxID=363265 RepID=UPI001F3D6D4C|nr:MULTISPECIES: hypothetical protein [Prevotellaceae]MCF2578225.1 hypothetical protein [Leyella stercorea]MCI7184425.1 hypothetical protein [Prevotella sp.]
MKYILLTIITLMLFTACAKTDDEKAQDLLAQIDQLYAKGKYKETLDSITVLRDRFPMALESRRKALVVWQKASLAMAQKDVANTDIRLQEVARQIEETTDRLTRNMLLVKRDSLQARYEAMCGVVRMIHARQKQ